jgi:hypothetical protein
VRGDKVAFIKVIRRSKREYTNLWIMNSDGSEPRLEIETDQPDTPFYAKTITTCLLSDNGDQVAFVTEPWRSGPDPNPVLWWTESGGTRVKKLEMNLPRHRWFNLVHWPEEDQQIFLTAQEKTEKVVPNKKLIVADIEEGTYRVLFENIFYHTMLSVSPRRDYFILRFNHPEDQRMHLVLFDVRTHKVKDIFASKALGVIRIRWNRDGDQIIFSRKTDGMELWKYSLSDETVKKIEYGAMAHGLGYDWLTSDDRIVLSDIASDETWLRVLDDDLNDIKKVRLPDHLQRHWNIWGLDNAVLVQSSRRGGFWVLDLSTEKWKKVF